MTNGNAKRWWWLAVRNSPLVAGAVNLGLAGWVLLGIRPGQPHVGEGMAVVMYLMIGTVMCVPARFARSHGVRVACLVIGGIPTGLLGLALAGGTATRGTSILGAAVLLVWATAFGCVMLLERAWSKGAVARAGCCVECGYDRRGLRVAVCPECGAKG